MRFAQRVGGGGEEDEPNARTPPHPQRGAVVSKFRAGLKLRIRLFYRSGISYRDQEVSRQRRKSQLQDSKVADRHLGSVMPQWNSTVQEIDLGLLSLCQQIIRCAMFSILLVSNISYWSIPYGCCLETEADPNTTDEISNSPINIVTRKVRYLSSLDDESFLVVAQMLVDVGAFLDELDNKGISTLEILETKKVQMFRRNDLRAISSLNSFIRTFVPRRKLSPPLAQFVSKRIPSFVKHGQPSYWCLSNFSIYFPPVLTLYLKFKL